MSSSAIGMSLRCKTTTWRLELGSGYSYKGSGDKKVPNDLAIVLKEVLEKFPGRLVGRGEVLAGSVLPRARDSPRSVSKARSYSPFSGRMEHLSE